MFKKITSKLIFIFVVIGLIPIILFGAYSINKARLTSVETATEGNKKIATQVAGRIFQYLHNSELILNALTENINRADLKERQRETILRNYANNFEEFTYLRIIDLDGHVTATSEIINPKINFKDARGFTGALKGKMVISDVFMTDDLVPAILFFLPIKRLNEVDAVLMTEVDLLHMWKLVESLKIGQKGYLNILTPDGKLFASGNGEIKILAISMTSYPALKQLKSLVGHSFERFQGDDKLLVVSAQLPKPFQWIVTVEQPITEAYALSFAMTRQLIISVCIFLLSMVLFGIFLGNQQIVKPISKIMRRIREIARGKLSGEVTIKGEGEFTELARTLNNMSEELIQIQDELVKKEKHALLGQIASSIAHDLKHPITNIENYTRLLEMKYQDLEYRKKFLTTVKTEFEKIHVFLENLRDLTKEIPFKPVSTSLKKVIEDVLLAQMPNFEENKIRVEKDWNSDIQASIDLFSFQRVLTNIINNAVEAMPKGGVLTMEMDRHISSTRGIGNETVIKIKDTGVGIKPEKLDSLFDDFVTTKRTGLGLGLAISQKIIHQHGGKIDVESTVGVGTCFSLILPLDK